MKAEIIAVGSELLTPDRLDTNSLFLTEELNKLGMKEWLKWVVGEVMLHIQAMVEAIWEVDQVMPKARTMKRDRK